MQPVIRRGWTNRYSINCSHCFTCSLKISELRKLLSYLSQWPKLDTFFISRRGSFHLKRKPLCQEELNAVYRKADRLLWVKEKIIQFVDHTLCLSSRERHCETSIRSQWIIFQKQSAEPTHFSWRCHSAEHQCLPGCPCNWAHAPGGPAKSALAGQGQPGS